MRRLHTWTRDLHLCLGLFFAPLLLIFAVSTLYLNHPGWISAAPTGQRSSLRQPIRIETSAGAGSIEQAKDILRQLGVTGEIDYISHSPKEERLVIPVRKPGEILNVEVDLRGGNATVERETLALGAALTYLHKQPGPHNARFRGNWVYMAWWAIAADGAVFSVFFLTVTGLILWWMLRTERRAGWLLLLTGAASALALAAALCLS